MNEYLIQQKIKTLSHLEVGLEVQNNHEPLMNIDGYSFKHWDFGKGYGWKGDAWIAGKKIKAVNALEAINDFRKNLDKIIQKVGFLSQCYMDFYFESLIALKTNNNDENIFLFRHIRDKDPVGLSFTNESLNDYNKIKDFEYSDAFIFLREVRNTSGYIPRLVLLFSTLEALCDKTKKTKENGGVYITYNSKTMKEILGGDLFNKIYGKGGIRHKLDHGEMVDLQKFPIEKIYYPIVEYINKKCNTDINIDVKQPMRHFDGNKFQHPFWLKPSEGFEINIKSCIENFNEKQNKVDGCTYLVSFDFKDY